MMAEQTNITWADHTWNPWIGCQKVSPACDGCYAEYLMDMRFGRVAWGPHGERVRTSPQTWNDPFRWDRKAAATGTRPFVFCASLADVFDNKVPTQWRAEAFDVMRRTPHLVYLLLTKRPSNIVRLSVEAGGLPANAAIGTTAEDQKRANRNVPDLLDASVELWKLDMRPLFTFVSCEPLLGHIDLTGFLEVEGGDYHIDALSGRIWMSAGRNTIPGTGHIEGDRDYVGLCHSLGWVITGGETSQGEHLARPTHPARFISLRNQCAAAGVPFHHKQNGEYLPEDWFDADRFAWQAGTDDPRVHRFDDGTACIRIGKRQAGRFLDGKLHDARPIVADVGKAVAS